MTDPSYDSFLARYPRYSALSHIDALRESDYHRLDERGHVYLDYTGGGLLAASQVRQHLALLLTEVYGNPHSSNPTSTAATRLVESARRAVLAHFNAAEEEYAVIFTANASGALKLVGESYPFAGGRYLLTFDNHNSVNGIREFARSHGAEVTYVPVDLPDLRVSEEILLGELEKGAGSSSRRLFAFPAQSNFSSVQHPLRWIETAHDRGWDVLLDAAAFAPTNRLDLGAWKPDFVPLSFYKMFGYPTGIGALLVRREKLGLLRRPWFSGGTITVASVQGDRYYLDEGSAGFEDGTVDYLGIPAVEIGLRHLQTVGLDAIHERVRSLTGWLLGNLLEMRHPSGIPLVRIYGPTELEGRGAAVALNFVNAKGGAIDHRVIEAKANKVGISLRTGCFCNPGAGEIALGISRDELVTCFTSPAHNTRLSAEDFRTCIDRKSTGAVRVSLGIVSNFRDVQAFLEFARGFLDR